MRIGILVVGSYVGLAVAALMYFRDHRGYEDLRFADFLAPWRWRNFHVARGNHFVATAQRCVKERKFREALLYARTGIRLSPANRAGRLLLAEMLTAADRLPSARDVLLEGLPFHRAESDYVKAALTLLLQRQEDTQVAELARRFLPTLDRESEAARLFGLGAASAHYFRGNYDQAENILRGIPRLCYSRDGRLLLARIERDRGYADLALLQLRQLRAEYPRDWEIQREFVELLRRRGLTTEALRCSLSFQIANPHQSAPRIALLQAYREAGETMQVAREVEALMRDFSADRAALIELAEFAANSGDVELVRRLTQHASGRGLPIEPYRFLAIEAAIVAQDYRGALEWIRNCETDEQAYEQRQMAVFDSLRAIAHCGLRDGASARLFLNKFLGQPDLRAENLLAVANRFAALDAPENAWQTLAAAVKVDPLNQAALARLIELDLVLNRVDDLAQHVKRFVTMRRPSPEILRVVQHKLGSDLFLYSPENPEVLALVHATLERARESMR